MCNLEEKFTLEQIKAAFWAEFHKSGEIWFDYLSEDGECQNSTESVWGSFIENLRKEQNND